MKAVSTSRPRSACAGDRPRAEDIPGALRAEIVAVDDPPAIDPIVAARVAHLHYVSDRMPGIRRQHVGADFIYRGPDGRTIRDPEELRRIKSIGGPPAWTDVWICPDPDGHIQAVGYDARGRKQYRYHPRWRAVRDETKFEHMLTFERSLPPIRRRGEADLDRPGLPREKVLAAVARLIERTLGRVGNPEYARQNETFGLTTLRRDHVRIQGGQIELDFRGKHGVLHHKVISDPTLTRIIKDCTDLPGSVLFKYLDRAGLSHHISSHHVNAYLRETSGHHITAKDFRTRAATNLAVLEIVAMGDARQTRSGVVTIVKRVAAQLGNTPAVCRKSYIHPRVLASYLDGSLRPTLAMLEASVREPEIWAVEGVVMRLLTESQAGGARATAEADRAVRQALDG